MGFVAIIGSGRSGTNLMALALEHDGPGFRNLYENRYVWSYGQRDLSCDNRGAEDATPKVKQYIRKHFFGIRNNEDEILIDKTPSNSLRIPFVAAVIPDAKFINVIRDGRHNLVSRARQWDGELKSKNSNDYMAAGPAKIVADRYRHMRRLVTRSNLPLARIPRMLVEELPTLLSHLVTGRSPRYAERVAGLGHILAKLGLDVASAVQWRETVMTAHTDGRRLGPDRFLEIRYEDLVTHPEPTWRQVTDFIGQSSGGSFSYLKDTLQPHYAAVDYSESEWRRIRAVEAHIRPTLEYLGYVW